MNKLRLVTGLMLLLVGSVGAADSEIRIVHRPRQTQETGAGTQRHVLEDPEAHGGTAQAAIPGTSTPNSTVFSFYSYARPAGLYRITCRVKVDDNTISNVVLKVSTGGGGKGFASGSISIKGTDFDAPNVYQDFSYTAEKGEGGFFGVGSSWPGQGLVLVDSVIVTSERLYDEKEILKRSGGFKLPDEWILPPASIPRVHLGKGLWWNFFGLSEAMGELGAATVTSSYHASGQWGRSLRYFPGSGEALMAHNLVVLANVDAQAVGTRGRLLLEEYVKNGGGLFIFGGPFALGGGSYGHSALERLLPCVTAGKARVKAEVPLVMTATPEASDLLPAGLSWELKPRIYYYHELEAKPDARVLLKMGDHPLLMIAEVGLGRVAVLAASAEGDPGADELPFWEWGDMPRLVASVCDWLISAPRPVQVHTIDEKDRQVLEQLAVPTIGDDETAKRSRQVRRLLARCRDKAFASDLLMAVSSIEGTPDHAFVDAVARSVRPYVDADFRDEADALIDTGEAGKASLGVRVLGMAGNASAVPRVRKFLEEGVGALSSGSLADLFDTDGGMPSSMSPDIGGGEKVKLAAVLALGDLGDTDSLALLQRTTRRLASKRQGFLEITELAQLNEDGYQQSLATRCRLGDAKAVGPFLSVIVKTDGEIEQFQNYLDTMLVNPDDKKLMHGRKVGRIRLPELRRRQVAYSDALMRVPYSLSATVVAELMRRDEPVLIPYAFAALTPNANRSLTREAVLSLLPLLRGSPFPELRLLAFRMGSELGDDEVTQQLASVLVELAAMQDKGAPRFALRRLAELPAAQRAPVVAAALKHPDPAIQRLARLSLPLIPSDVRKALAAGQ